MKIKSLLFSLALAISVSNAFATDPSGQEKCGTLNHMDYLMSKDPSLRQRMIDDEQNLQQALTRITDSRTASPNVIYTIPVVVHVVYRTTGQNISDAQIVSQIAVLNEDFGRYNADTTNTPALFRSVASATQFQFCLAKRDPSGNATTGIERRLTTVTSFNTNDLMKYDSTGGKNCWDVNKYLNIWVCNMGGGILGYGEFPTSVHTNTFGVALQYNAFGRVGTLQATYNLGRTCTHEFSHCFRLFHIWGDDGGACSGTDYVNDTPNQADATFGCYTFPHVDACATASPGIMFMNYMDYSDDNCLNMFTSGQASRMYASINAYYRTLFSSDGCQIVDNIANAADDFTFSIYPNPTEGMISLDMFTSNNIGKKVYVRVTNTLGQVVNLSEIINPVGNVSNIDLSGNPKGLYFVSVYNDKFSKTSRVILN